MCWVSNLQSHMHMMLWISASQRHKLHLTDNSPPQGCAPKVLGQLRAHAYVYTHAPDKHRQISRQQPPPIYTDDTHNRHQHAQVNSELRVLFFLLLVSISPNACTSARACANAYPQSRLYPQPHNRFSPKP